MYHRRRSEYTRFHIDARKGIETGDPGGKYGQVEGEDDRHPSETRFGHLVRATVRRHVQQGPAERITQYRPCHKEREQ